MNFDEFVRGNPIVFGKVMMDSLGRHLNDPINHPNVAEADRDFTGDEQTEITNALRLIYDGSEEVRKMFDTWVKANPGQSITINYNPHQAWALPNTGQVGIDIRLIKAIMYIDNNGNAVNHTLASVLVHELGHALTGRLDDGVNYDVPGSPFFPFFNGDRSDYKGQT